MSKCSFDSKRFRIIYLCVRTTRISCFLSRSYIAWHYKALEWNDHRLRVFRVLVDDGKKSAEWYRDKLGFEIVGIEGHGVFVRPKASQGLLLHLCARCDDRGNDQPGGRTGIWLRCGETVILKDDKTVVVIPASKPVEVERTYLELKKNGVEFSMELTTTSWGKMAILKDLDGNEIEIS